MAALLSGLAIGLKADRVVVIAALLAAFVYARPRAHLRDLGVAGILILVGFVIANPSIIITPFGFVDGYTRDLWFNALRSPRDNEYLALLRNRVLVGSTVAILIGAGTINGLMYLLSLYFQNPAVLDFSPLQAGLATLPATVGLVVVAPLVPRLAARFGGRQTVGIGFALTTAGFVVVGFVDDSWKYAAFLLPLIAIAVGMGLSNGPSSSAATAAVPENQVGGASGVSNMARYVGAAVATALAATIYGTRIDDRTAAGASPGEALASGLAAAAWMMAIFSFLGVLMAVVMGRHRAPVGTLDDAAAAAAAHTHTLPTSATTGRDVTADA